jgi:hypothetical protein
MDVQRLARRALQPFAVLVLLGTAFGAPSASFDKNWALAAPLWILFGAAFFVVSQRSAARAAVAGGAFRRWSRRVPGDRVVGISRSAEAALGLARGRRRGRGRRTRACRAAPG